MAVLRLPADIRERTVRDVLDERAVSRAGHVALIAPSLVHGGTVELTYAELQAAAGELAAVFAAAGVGKGDRVAIMVDNHGAAEAHVAYHASHRVGAINVPINARYVPRELRYVLGFVEPAAIVFAGGFAPVLAELGDVLAGAARLEIAEEPALGTAYAAAIAAAARSAGPGAAPRGRRRRLDLHLRHHGQPQGGRDHPRPVGGLRPPGGPAVPARARQRLPVVRAVLHQHRLPHEPARLPRRRVHLRGGAGVPRGRHARADATPRHDLDLPDQHGHAADLRPPRGGRAGRRGLPRPAAHLLRRPAGRSRPRAPDPRGRRAHGRGAREHLRADRERERRADARARGPARGAAPHRPVRHVDRAHAVPPVGRVPGLRSRGRRAGARRARRAVDARAVDDVALRARPGGDRRGASRRLGAHRRHVHRPTTRASSTTSTGASS